jgi:hypothetical protein
VPMFQRLAHRVLRAVPAPVAIGLILAMATPASANVRLSIVSQDTTTNTDSYHATEVEPDTFAFGTTIVSDFQVGRFTDGGASTIGYATSVDSGQHWTHGNLPSLTIYSTPAGPYKRATDPAIAFDPKHNVWMTITLDSMASFGFTGNAVTVSRSTDGGLTFNAPVTVKTTSSTNFDSTWGSCDTWPQSPNYGNCYVEWDDFGLGNTLHMSRSTDGGLTWTASTVPQNTVVIGGKPVSMPNGTVVVPIDDGFTTSVQSFVSTNGGSSYTGPVTVSTISTIHPAGGIRELPIPSAGVDSSGKVYVIWPDCRFRSGCPSNDIVMSTSMNGTTWTPVVRVPIDPVTSTDDHFLAGIAVDTATLGHIGVVFYFYPVANCTSSTCKLEVGFTSSPDGGATWTPARQLAGPFKLTGLPNTTQGYMVGDYNSADFINGGAHTVFAVASGNNCVLGQITSCKEAMASPRQALDGADGPMVPAGHDRVVALGYNPSSGLQSLR